MVKSMIVKDGIRMEFFKVQIPYRGVIPIINRKGPMACVELTRDQINELKSYGVELLNPNNGKKFLFPEQQPVEITLKDFANARPVTKAQLEVKAEHVEHPKEEVSAEPEDAEVSGEETDSADQDVADEVEETVEEAADVTDEPTVLHFEEGTDEGVAEPSLAETLPTVESAEPEAAEFDYTKVSGYSSLSKSKKKEIRSLFKHKMNSGMSAEGAYAELNAMIAEL